jgi:cytochrome b561
VSAAWSPGQKALHWLVAALVAGLVAAGLAMTNLGDGDLKNRLYELHKSFGLVVLAALLPRLVLRALRGAPPPVPMPAWQRLAARASHGLLYALAVVVPVLGWAGTSACCAPVEWFGLLPLTLPIGGGMERGAAILAVHRVLALTLAGLAVLHAGAALHHHLVRRDAALRRILP